jgi:hypothetical protein
MCAISSGIGDQQILKKKENKKILAACRHGFKKKMTWQWCYCLLFHLLLAPLSHVEGVVT